MSEYDFGTSPTRDWIGRVIDDRYHVTDLIGEGGMGAVFVADHLTLHKEVALKIVRPEHGDNGDLAMRFAREAMVTSRLDHPNVISALDYGVLDTGEAYLVMQLVRGPSLKDLREREGSIHWSRAARIGAQIADALLAASAHGIVHRDLKPENILVQRMEDGTDLAKVLDFGIAKFSRDSLAPPPFRQGQAVTEVGVVIGTPGYMAPEQAVGRSADYRSDLYSLGVLLWESIAGRLLWLGDDVQTIVQNQLREDAPSLREHTGDLTIPDELDELVAALLQDFPDKRPSDVAEVRDVLRQVAASGAGARTTPLDLTTDRLSGTGNRVVTGATPRASTPDAAVAPPPPAPITDSSTPLTAQTPRPPALPRRGTIWGLIAALMLATAAVLISTGQLELRPKGDLEKVTSTLVPPSPEPEPSRAQPVVEAPPAEPEEVPEALKASLGLLVQGETRSERVDAAKAIVGYVPMEEVPSYARSLAHFQLAETCPDKKQELERIAELGDLRVLPMLVLTSERGKKGCGPKGRKDCLGCMREEMDALIGRLREAELAGQPAGAVEAAEAAEVAEPPPAP